MSNLGDKEDGVSGVDLYEGSAGTFNPDSSNPVYRYSLHPDDLVPYRRNFSIYSIGELSEGTKSKSCCKRIFGFLLLISIGVAIAVTVTLGVMMTQPKNRHLQTMQDPHEISDVTLRMQERLLMEDICPMIEVLFRTRNHDNRLYRMSSCQFYLTKKTNKFEMSFTFDVDENFILHTVKNLKRIVFANSGFLHHVPEMFNLTLGSRDQRNNSMVEVGFHENTLQGVTHTSSSVVASSTHAPVASKMSTQGGQELSSLPMQNMATDSMNVMPTDPVTNSFASGQTRSFKFVPEIPVISSYGDFETLAASEYLSPSKDKSQLLSTDSGHQLGHPILTTEVGSRIATDLVQQPSSVNLQSAEVSSSTEGVIRATHNDSIFPSSQFEKDPLTVQTTPSDITGLEYASVQGHELFTSGNETQQQLPNLSLAPPVSDAQVFPFGLLNDSFALTSLRPPEISFNSSAIGLFPVSNFTGLESWDSYGINATDWAWLLGADPLGNQTWDTFVAPENLQDIPELASISEVLPSQFEFIGKYQSNWIPDSINAIEQRTARPTSHTTGSVHSQAGGMADTSIIAPTRTFSETNYGKTITWFPKSVDNKLAYSSAMKAEEISTSSPLENKRNTGIITKILDDSESSGLRKISDTSKTSGTIKTFQSKYVMKSSEIIVQSNSAMEMSEAKQSNDHVMSSQMFQNSGLIKTLETPQNWNLFKYLDAVQSSDLIKPSESVQSSGSAKILEVYRSSYSEYLKPSEVIQSSGSILTS